MTTEAGIDFWGDFARNLADFAKKAVAREKKQNVRFTPLTSRFARSSLRSARDYPQDLLYEYLNFDWHIQL